MTLSIDDDVLAYACQAAESTGKPLGTVISELARDAIDKHPPGETRNGITLLPAGNQAGHATLKDVNRLRDELP